MDIKGGVWLILSGSFFVFGGGEIYDFLNSRCVSQPIVGYDILWVGKHTSCIVVGLLIVRWKYAI